MSRLAKLAVTFVILTLLFAFWAIVLSYKVRAQTPVRPLRPIPVLQSKQFVSAGALMQGPWHPHDPQHREPPEGWVCTNPGPGVPKDHECDCKHKCVQNKQPVNCREDDTGDGGQICDEVDAPGMHVEENAKCSVYCHPKHCACDVKGCQST